MNACDDCRSANVNGKGCFRGSDPLVCNNYRKAICVGCKSKCPLAGKGRWVINCLNHDGEV